MVPSWLRSRVMVCSMTMGKPGGSILSNVCI